MTLAGMGGFVTGSDGPGGDAGFLGLELAVGEPFQFLPHAGRRPKSRSSGRRTASVRAKVPTSGGSAKLLRVGGVAAIRSARGSA
jgi:hypothetical protein